MNRHPSSPTATPAAPAGVAVREPAESATAAAGSGSVSRQVTDSAPAWSVRQGVSGVSSGGAGVPVGAVSGVTLRPPATYPGGMLDDSGSPISHEVDGPFPLPGAAPPRAPDPDGSSGPLPVTSVPASVEASRPSMKLLSVANPAKSGVSFRLTGLVEAAPAEGTAGREAGQAAAPPGATSSSDATAHPEGPPAGDDDTETRSPVAAAVLSRVPALIFPIGSDAKPRKKGRAAVARPAVPVGHDVGQDVGQDVVRAGERPPVATGGTAGAVGRLSVRDVRDPSTPVPGSVPMPGSLLGTASASVGSADDGQVPTASAHAEEARLDAGLVIAARGGDREAFSRLIERYQKRAAFVAYRLLGSRDDALEVSQEAFIRAWSRLEDLKEPHKFAGWLLRTVTNLSLNYRRDRRKWDAVSLDDSPDGGSADGSGFDTRERSEPGLPGRTIPPSAPAQLAAQELADAARAAIDRLPAKQRMALLLFGIDGLPQQQVAELLETSVEAVKWHVFQARRKLKEMLKDRI